MTIKHDEHVLGAEHIEQVLDVGFKDDMPIDDFPVDTRRHCEMDVERDGTS